MKRHAALVRLSREHHTALVLARHAVQLDTGDAAAVAAFAARLAGVMESEMLPHFAREEAALLPLLAPYDAPLVERTLDDHRRLLALADEIRGGNPAAIASFGRNLEGHVHFEERMLFAVAETVLSAGEFQALVDSY